MKTEPPMDEIKAAAGKVLQSYAGYMNTWTIELGLRMGLFEKLHETPGTTAKDLAAALGYDPLYTSVWCNSAYAGGFIEASNGGFALATHMDKILLDREFPMAAGHTSYTMTAFRDHMVSFRDRFASGERTWWDKTSVEFREGVGMASYPFYVRTVKAALPKMAGVHAALERGGNVLELACGTCQGISLLSKAYPKATFTGVDGDAGTLEMAQEKLTKAGIEGVQLVQSMLEDLSFHEEFDVVFINVSLHEARDMKKVLANVLRALKPGGWFVVSDFAFPENQEGLRTVPGQIMSGIQYFEALIDDQLLPIPEYAAHMTKAGFRDVQTIEVSPIHGIAYGRK